MQGRAIKLESVDSMAELSDLQSGLALGLLGMAPLQRRCTFYTPSTLGGVIKVILRSWSIMIESCYLKKSC